MSTANERDADANVMGREWNGSDCNEQQG